MTNLETIYERIKMLEKKLSDAEWENRIEEIEKLKSEIKSFNISLSLGEKYIIPF
jgi:hypothetical protein